jgi:hypothetical protein
MDPITLIVTALAAGAAAGLTDTVSQAVKDAYAGLKGLIARKYTKAAPSVDQLEAAPESKARRGVVEEDLGKTAAAGDVEVLRQAQALLDAVQKYAPDAARTIGVDLKDVEAGSLKLNDIIVQASGAATGAQLNKVKVAGDFTITGVHVTSSAASGAPAPRLPSDAAAANPQQVFLGRLRSALADCFPDRNRAKTLVQDAGLSLAAVDLSGQPSAFWQEIVDEAARQGKIEALLDLALRQAPARADLAALRAEFRNQTNQT